MTTVFICISTSGYWGRSTSNIFEAIKNARVHSYDRDFILFAIQSETPDIVGVNDMGGLTHGMNDNIVKLHTDSTAMNIEPLLDISICVEFLKKDLDDTRIMHRQLWDALDNYEFEHNAG